MTQQADDVRQQLAQLKKAFDESFASPPEAVRRDGAEFLMISAGGQSYALRITELAGLEVDRKIVPVPADKPSLLGLCAVQGQLVAAFDLAAIVARAPRKASARWIALHREKELVALAFDEFLGSRRVAAADIHNVEAAPQQPHLSTQAIEVDSRLVHVVDIPSVVASIRQGIHPR